MFYGRTAIFVGVGMTIAFCSGCGSPDTASNDASTAHASPPSSTVPAAPTPAPVAEPVCNVGVPGPPTTQSAFTDHLPDHFLVKEICASDVGPALDGKDAVAGLSDLAAAEITDSYSSPDRLVLKALVGQVKSGDTNSFVDAFMSRTGETRIDTVTLGGHSVRYFNTPGGEGYAFADGSTVAIGYIPPPTVQLAATQEGAKDLFTRVIAAATGKPIPPDSNDGVVSGIEGFSPGRGRYTTASDPGWIFFKTESIKGEPSQFCGIGPNGSIAGCDLVPGQGVPAGMNQTVVDANGPAHYARSDTTTFTRDVDVLLEGHRLDNGQARCGRGYQGTIHCAIGDHGFVVSTQYGVLE